MTTEKKTRYFRIGDAIVIACVLLLAVLFLCGLLGAKKGKTVEICDQNGLVQTLSLDESGSVRVERNGICITVAVQEGKAFVQESDCPGGDCVKMGAISRQGSCIVCAPAGLVIRIVGGGERDADFVAG